MTIYPYQTQVVRDLAWAVFSPNMLHVDALSDNRTGAGDCTFELTSSRQLWLEQLDRDAGPLTTHLASSRSRRLGIYFEKLWHFFLDADPATELLAHNLPVSADGRTIGEFDVLYYCHRRRAHVHLELAVKYYLGLNSPVAEPVWLGPDRRDSLHNKLHHLLQRQICLGDSLAGANTLQKLGIDSTIREIALKGYLFQPAGNPIERPPHCQRACQFGHWTPLSALQDVIRDSRATHFLPLPKMRWLSSAKDANLSLTARAHELESTVIERFKDDHYPMLIAALDASGSEVVRFFVTPEGWPGPLQAED